MRPTQTAKGVGPHRRGFSRRLVALMAGWLLGAMAGSGGATLLAGRHLHRALQEREALRQQVSDLQVRLQRLEESLRQRRRRPIRSVHVEVQGLDPSDELRLIERVRTLLQEFVGREVDQVDPALVARVLDGRLVPLDGRTVTLGLRSLWVSDQLTVRLELTATPVR